MNDRIEIDWSTVDASTLPECSALRCALEDGRPDVAAWLISTYPDGARLYVHSERTVRRWVFREAIARLLESGTAARAAARLFGIDRGAVRKMPQRAEERIGI